MHVGPTRYRGDLVPEFQPETNLPVCTGAVGGYSAPATGELPVVPSRPQMATG
jgi:hypothetical protein